MDSCWPARFSCWLGVADSVNVCQQVLDRVFVVSFLVHLTHVSDSTYWKPGKDCHYSTLIRFWYLCLSGCVWIIGQHVAQSSWWQPVEPSLPSKVHANCLEGLVSFGFQKSSPHALQKGCRQLGLGPMGKGDQKSPRRWVTDQHRLKKKVETRTRESNPDIFRVQKFTVAGHRRPKPGGWRSRTDPNHPTHWSSADHCSVQWKPQKWWDMHVQSLQARCCRTGVGWALLNHTQQPHRFCTFFNENVWSLYRIIWAHGALTSELCILDLCKVSLEVETNVEKKEEDLGPQRTANRPMSQTTSKEDVLHYQFAGMESN